MLNTRITHKIVLIPSASTFPGRVITFKDICGNAGVSSIFFSTTGLDIIENNIVTPSPIYYMSTNNGAVALASDGIRNWMILQHYISNIIPRAAPPFVIVTANLIHNLDAATYVSGASTWTALVGNTVATFNSPTTVTTPGGPTAITFNGSSYSLDTTGIASSNFIDFTIDVWFFANSGITVSVVGEMGQASQDGFWNVTLVSLKDNTMFVGFWIGSVYQLSLGSYSANTWTHLSYTYAGTTVTGFVNGVQVNTGTATKQRPGTSHYGVGSAANPYTNLTGSVGAYKLYNTALTATQVRQNYNALAARFGRPTI